MSFGNQVYDFSNNSTLVLTSVNDNDQIMNDQLFLDNDFFTNILAETKIECDFESLLNNIPEENSTSFSNINNEDSIISSIGSTRSFTNSSEYITPSSDMECWSIQKKSKKIKKHKAPSDGLTTAQRYDRKRKEEKNRLLAEVLSYENDVNNLKEKISLTKYNIKIIRGILVEACAKRFQ
jgi:hypothetical protein